MAASAERSAADRSWWPSPEARAAIAAEFAASAAELTTAALTRIAASYSWFADLEPEQRSSITLVARSGIDGFVAWFASGGQGTPANIFAAAPPALARRISLNQTVDLVRTTIETVEDQIAGLPTDEQLPLRIGILRYSREIAFASANIYARAAEQRGAWDARIEAMVVDAILRGDTDETVTSRASTLGWVGNPALVAVVIGAAPADPLAAVETIRAATTRLSLDLLAAPQGDRLVLVLGGDLESSERLAKRVAGFVDRFGPGPVVIGPPVAQLTLSTQSARAALSAMRVARAWPDAPRPVTAQDLLPERAVAGEGSARRTLAGELYQPLVAAGGDLVETLSRYFDVGGSVEAAARVLFVHPNTVRYRLRRVQDLTGYSPFDARDADALRLARTFGRLRD